MFNVYCHYGVAKLTPSTYSVSLNVEELTHANYEQVILELGERVRAIMEDGLLEYTEDGLSAIPRKKVVFTLSPSYVLQKEKEEAEKKVVEEAKQNSILDKASGASQELLGIVEEVCLDDKAKKVKNAEDKALNSLVGMVLKRIIYEPAVVKQCIINELFKVGII